MDVREEPEADAAQLAAMGYTTSLRRNFTPLSIFGLAFTILNSWVVLAASLPLSLSTGGPSVAVWGLLVAGAGNLCLAVSLAEFISAYPTAGGQYHWVAALSPKEHSRFLAWVTGWITTFGWIAVTASASLMNSQAIVGLVMRREEQEGFRGLQDFLVYFALTLFAFAVNVWMSSHLPSLNKTALYWSVMGLLVIPVITVTLSWSHWSSPSFVFSGFLNETGWPGQCSTILLSWCCC